MSSFKVGDTVISMEPGRTGCAEWDVGNYVWQQASVLTRIVKISSNGDVLLLVDRNGKYYTRCSSFNKLVQKSMEMHYEIY